MNRPLLFPSRLVWLALTLAGTASLRAQTPVVTKVLDQGSNDTHINVVIFSEGYTSAELASKFSTDVNALLNSFFKASPYSEYKPYFNVYTVAVPSNQSGSDHLTPSPVSKDTYFNSSFDCYGLQRLVTLPPNDLDGNYADGQGKIDSLLMTYVPDYDLTMVIVNDSTYGGSGGETCVASTNASSSEILIHESGHTFGHLGDEYGDPYPGYPDTEEPNTTTQTNRSLVKWGAWIASSTPLPTPDTSAYSSVIGLFEGAHYHYTGWYRPKSNCRMRTLGVDFCSVCQEALVLSVYADLRPIESSLPATTTVSGQQGTRLVFKVVEQTPATHPLSTQWSVDGSAVSDATSATFSTTTLGVGTHTVSVAVADPTPLVRTDPNNLLKDARTWTVQITGSSGAPVVAGATAGSGTVGQPFSYQIATVSNDATSFAATGLPAGLSVDAATGLISGTPTAAGTFTVSLSASNGLGTGNAALTLTISDTLAPPVISSATTLSEAVGQAFSFQIVASNAPTLYGANGLPAGVGINTATGLISGTATESGEYTVTLTATNAGGTGSGPLKLIVADAAPVVVTIEATVPQVGVGSGLTGQFTLTRTGDLSQDLFVYYTVKGSGEPGVDYVALKGRAKIKAGKATKVVKIVPLGDLGGAAKKTVKVTLQENSGYTLGDALTAKGKIVQ